jgi:hypothetical protein
MIRRSLLTLALSLGLAIPLLAADPTGKWSGSVDTPNGPMELTFEFMAEGETLTGTVTSAMGSLPISNGKVSGDQLTFDVTLEASKITHEATLNASGDEIAVKATGDWGTAEYVVKKVVAPPPQ